jgi:hypothetical protein
MHNATVNWTRSSVTVTTVYPTTVGRFEENNNKSRVFVIYVSRKTFSLGLSLNEVELEAFMIALNFKKLSKSSNKSLKNYQMI